MRKFIVVSLFLLIFSSILVATNTKVAIMPFEKMDRSSDYIVKMLNIRDLELIFSKNSQFQVVGIKQSKEALGDLNGKKIDELDPDDILETGKKLGVDIVITGTVTTIDSRTFQVQTKVYSENTSEVTPISFSVTKNKYERWESMQKNFITKVDAFITNEITKMVAQATQQFDQENNQAAEEGFQKVLSADPKNVTALLYLGSIYLEKKDYANAESYLNRGVALDSTNVKILNTLFNTYKEENKTESALQTLKKVAQLSKDEEIWLALANMQAENGDSRGAAESLDQALVINPTYNKAIYRYGLLYYDDKKYNDAIPYLEKATLSYPDDPQLAKKLAFSYQSTGKLDDAVKKFEQVAAANPTNVSAFYNLAGIYRAAAGDAADKKNSALELSYNKKALNTLNQLKIFAPESSLLYLRFADVYSAMNDLSNAEMNATMSIQNDPSNYSPYLILSSINQKRGSDKYNQFVDLEKSASKAIGKKADALIKQRDAAKQDAYNYFKLADEQLNAAKTRTADKSVISDINARISALQPLLNQTKKGFF
ncbi:MAG TPA: tetratricopeptide repeat protein [Candidatus Cloacimonadota bacterium]|nr:tetratricopeptide repeat protein [Candidatus Cloacimonadota bacterium]